MMKKRKSAAATIKTTGKTTATQSPTPPKKQKKIEEQPPPKMESPQPPKIEEKPQPPTIEEKIPPIEEVEDEIEEEIEEEVEEEGSEEEHVKVDEMAEEQPEKLVKEDEDDEPISSLIEPFTKEQLTVIVREAAQKHADVATIVRKLADKDIVHRKIFIHGLGWDTTTETLISAFKDYGEIEDCKAVTDKLTGKSKGYGFIVFKTRTGARKALKEPQKTISGRTASCQLAALGPAGNTSEKGSGSGYNAAPVGYQTEYTQRKIYISNVSAELDPAKLTAYFSKFGEIEDGPLGIDKGTGKFKGFCLFVYKSVESARKALEEPHKQYEGHTLHCQRAIDGPKAGKGQSGHSGGGYSAGGHGRGSGGGYVRGENPSLPMVSGGGLVGQGMVGAGVNPALGHALTALLASQGAGLGLNNLLGSLGGPGVASIGQSSGYGAPVGLSGYGSQTGLQSVYPNPQLGQGGGVGRSQHGGYSGAPYGGR